MKKCPECGTFVPDDNRFCTSCGASLADAQSVMDEITGEAQDATEEVTESVEEAAETVTETIEETAEAAETVTETVAETSETAEAPATEEVSSDEPIAASFAPQPPETAVAPVAAPGSDYGNDGSSSAQTTTAIPTGSTSGIAPRSIVLAIIFSYLTCGIYTLYWIYKLNEEINQISGEPGTSGGMVILFDIITCDIYNFYWSYKMGEKCDHITGDTDGISHVLYLILAICGLSIVGLALMQNTVNKKLGA